jgi:hypothetical protein
LSSQDPKAFASLDCAQNRLFTINLGKAVLGSETMNEQQIGVDSILEVTGANRESRAYAFLYAAFKRTDITSNPVRDALDCLIPFIGVHLSREAGNQVSVENLQNHLATTFGFRVPLYALEQLMPALQKDGYVEYKKHLRSYFAKDRASHFDVSKGEIETDFDDVEGELSRYADNLGFKITPPSGSWGDALITFLRSSSDGPEAKVANIKGALLEPMKVEGAIVGSFIKRIHGSNRDVFSKILNVFMGVLVEEFISSVAEIGTNKLPTPVIVFYDTAVILRLLGCSGTMLRVATEELTQYLQDMGFEIRYFSGNEAEVGGILDAIIHRKDSGYEIEGETASAMSDGEVDITELRMLQNTFPDKLARKNIFPAEDLEKSALENSAHQINERGFTEFLKQQALQKRTSYGYQNRENDAGYLGTIMRLRKRRNTRDLTACGYVFVTSNRFLANMSRRYLIKENSIRPQHCPPMLSVGQIATIAWLMKDHVLEPEKAGRELLSNCYAAFRPDQKWFRNFREGIEKVTGDLDEYAGVSQNMITLQAARRIAQEESFGESAIVPTLNMVEILNRAEAEAHRMVQDKEAQLVAEKAAAAEENQRALLEVEQESRARLEQAEANWRKEMEAATIDAHQIAREKSERERRLAAEGKADTILLILKVLATIAFVIATVATAFLQLSGGEPLLIFIVAMALAVPAVLSFLSLIHIPIADQLLKGARTRLANFFYT